MSDSKFGSLISTQRDNRYLRVWDVECPEKNATVLANQELEEAWVVAIRKFNEIYNPTNQSEIENEQ